MDQSPTMVGIVGSVIATATTTGTTVVAVSKAQ